MVIRIGTRGSELALWQAKHVQGLLLQHGADEVVLEIVKTQGDRIQDVALTPDLGRAFFTKDIEDALLAGRVDLAVHSLKDLAVEMPAGLVLAAIPARERPTERLLIHPDGHDIGGRFLPLRKGAVVGTASPRRRRRLLELRPDLDVRDLRGNVPTRVAKCQHGDYDAILLAYAGIARLGLELAPLHVRELPLELFCGAPGQGALGLQVRESDTALRELVGRLNHAATARAVHLERRLLKSLGGGCSLPFGAHATCGAEGPVHLRAYLFPPTSDGGSLQFEGESEDEAALLASAQAALLPAITRPLAGQTVIVVGGPQRTRIVQELATVGAELQFVQAFDYVDEALAAEDLEFVRAADHVLLSSKYAAARLEQELLARGLWLREDAVLLVTGRATREFTAALYAGHDVLVGEPPRSLGMGQAAIARGARRIASIGAAGGSDEGAAFAREHGAECRSLALYRTQPSEGITARWTSVLDGCAEGSVLYLAPSAVRAAPPQPQRRGLRWHAIGQATARSLEEHDLTDYDSAARPELAGVLALLRAEE